MKTIPQRIQTWTRTAGAALMMTLLLCAAPSVKAADKVGDAAYEAAAGLFNLGLWKQASESYKEYFAKHPRHPLAAHGHFGLGLCYFNLKDYAAAAKELSLAAKGEGPSKVESNLYLGQSLLLKTPSAPKPAESAFRNSLQALGFERTGIISRTWDRKSIDLWLEKNTDKKQQAFAADVFVGLLESSYLQNDWKSVVNKVAAFEGLVAGAPIEQRARVLTGEAQFNLQDYEAAAKAYEAGANLKGRDSGEALFRLGLVRLNHLKQYAVAAGHFKDFSAQHANDRKKADATFNEALCYYHSYYGGEEKHLADAIRLFDRFTAAYNKHDLAAVAQFYSGKLQHIRKDWAAAIKRFKPLVDSKNPALDQLIFLLGDSYHQQKDWVNSAKYYTQFAVGNEKKLNADVALHNAGVAYSNMREPDYKNAIAAYERLEARCAGSPHVPSAQLKLGIIHYEAGRFEEAKRPLAKIPANHTLKADADYFSAWAELDNGKPANAARKFKVLRERLTRSDAQSGLIAESHLYQGIAEFEARQFGASAQTLASFLKAHDSHEKVDEGAFNLGLAHMELSQWDQAIGSFDQVAAASPIRDRALYQSAWGKRSAGQHADSIPFYKELLEKHPRSQLVNNAALELAEVEFENGGPQGGVVAAERLEKLLDRKIDPQLRQLTLYRLGIVQFDLKAYGDSAKAFEELLKDVPKNLEVSAAWQAGEARREVARAANGEAKTQGLRAALVNYQTAAEAGSAGGNDGELQRQALLRIGETHASLEDWDASQKSYENFIAGNGNHKLIRTAHLGYGWSLHNQEKYDEALASYLKTVKDGIRDDTGARAQFLMGECFLEQNQHIKARTEFAKVDQLYAFPQWQSKGLFEMARSFAQEKQINEAKTVFNKLIEKYPETASARAAKEELNRLN